MNARLYDPALGRFLAPDPVVTDPSSLLDFNRYMYARNNPMLYTDESGESWKSFWQNFAAAWKRDWSKFIGGFDGGTVGFNTSGQVSFTPNYYGRPVGPAVGLDFNKNQATFGGYQNGFFQMQAVNYESNLQHAVITAETNARYEYFGKQNSYQPSLELDTYIGIMGFAAERGIGNSNWTYRLTNTKGAFDPTFYRSGWTPRGAVGKGLSVYKFSTLGSRLSFSADFITTGLAFDKISKGDAEPITYIDATVGFTGILATTATYYKGVKVPYVGKFVLIYGVVRTTWDVFMYLGFNYGPRHWYGIDDTKLFK